MSRAFRGESVRGGRRRRKKGTGISDDRKNIANSNRDKTVDFEGFSDECDCHGQMGKQQSALRWNGWESGCGELMRGLSYLN
jgi:hypothetical protein